MYLFLSPDWVRAVNQAVASAAVSNYYLRNLIKGFNLSLAYTVRGLPQTLKNTYGGADQAVIYARLERGVVRHAEVAGRLPAAKINVMLTSDYKVAKRLFLGESSPLASYLNGQLQVEVVNGFRQWPKVAARSAIAALTVAKIARKVPTAFGIRH